MRSPVAIVIVIGALMSAAIAGYVYLAVKQVETSRYEVFLAATVLPTITALLTYFKTTKLQEKVETVATQTDGIVSRQQEITVQALNVANQVQSDSPHSTTPKEGKHAD